MYLKFECAEKLGMLNFETAHCYCVTTAQQRMGGCNQHSSLQGYCEQNLVLGRFEIQPSLSLREAQALGQSWRNGSGT
jgi:hypothetical protein